MCIWQTRYLILDRRRSSTTSTTTTQASASLLVPWRSRKALSQLPTIQPHFKNCCTHIEKKKEPYTVTHTSHTNLRKLLGWLECQKNQCLKLRMAMLTSMLVALVLRNAGAVPASLFSDNSFFGFCLLGSTSLNLS